MNLFHYFDNLLSKPNKSLVAFIYSEQLEGILREIYSQLGLGQA